MGFDLQPTEEQQALKETLHDLAATVLRAQARDAERAKRTPADLARQIHEIGVCAPVDERFGGGGTFDAVTYCIAAEELAWGDPAIATQALGAGLPAIVIGVGGSEEQKERFLPAFVESEPPQTFVAVGEKVAGAELAALDTTIDGDTVTGTKYGVLNAVDPQFGVVIGRDGDAPAAAVVESDALEIVKPEDKLGLSAAPTHVVRFEGAGSSLPAGEELVKAILWTKLATGAIAVGIARAAWEYAAEYAKEREAFGKPIGAFQAISFKIADMAIAADSARMSLWRAAWMLDRGEADAAEVAAAVGQCLAAAVLCGDDSVQVLGGHGYITDHPVEMWFRDAVTLSVLDSPDIVGDALVGRSLMAEVTA